MTERVLDVRIVQGRDDAMRARMNGAPVALPPHTTYSAALRELARRIEGLAWARNTTEGDVLTELSRQP